MASISELRDRFLSMMGDKSEAAKAATLNLDPAPKLATSDYITISNDPYGVSGFTPWGVSAGTTITFTPSTPEVVEVPEQPDAEEVTPTLVDGEAAAYQRTCKAIGYEPAALVVEELLAFMQEKRIKRYDNAKVDEYLTAKAKKALGTGGVWYWKPLRAQDVGKEHEERGAAAGGWGESTSKKARKEPYQQAIPLRVLARVEQFMQKFGDKVRFLVSDYAEQKPDPFIAVVPKQGGVEPIVFDVWDEPDFK
jgi:hypothetical protein